MRLKDDNKNSSIVKSNSRWSEYVQQGSSILKPFYFLKVVEIQISLHIEIWVSPVDSTIVVQFGPLFSLKFTIQKFRFKMQAFETTSIFLGSRLQSH